MDTVKVVLELTREEAAALVQAQRTAYRLRLQAEFWDDRYRNIPHPMRHGSILAHCPDMSANKKLLGALAQGSKTESARGA
ncbi:MAG: hypothetical protein ACRBBM_12620 [Pseudomonadaceae bacterium]